MTDRHRTVTVLLDREMRSDDLEHILAAIRMIKGVSSVEAGPVDDMHAYVAIETAKNDLRRQLHNLLYPSDRKGS